MSEACYMGSVDTYYADKHSHDAEHAAGDIPEIQCNNACPLDKFKGCCQCCPENSLCPEACEYDPVECGDATFDEETGLATFQKSQLATLEKIAALVNQKKALEDQEKILKAALFTAMEKFGIKKFEFDVLNLTYVAPTVSHGIDTAKLKKKFPDVAAECAKNTPKAGYVKITLKEGEKT